MAQPPPRDQGHLVVAAVRVLAHKTGRPPAIEEIAALLDWSKEFAGHLVRALEPLGIVRTIKSPFDLRVEVADHAAVDQLPIEDRGPGLQSEVEEFHERFKKKQEELQNLFDSNELEKKRQERLAGLDRELRDFKNPRPDPFGGSSGGES